MLIISESTFPPNPLPPHNHDVFCRKTKTKTKTTGKHRLTCFCASCLLPVSVWLPSEILSLCLPVHRNKKPYQQESDFWSANLWNGLCSLNRTVVRQNQQPPFHGFPTLCGECIPVPCLNTVETSRGQHRRWMRHCNYNASSQTSLLLQIPLCPGTWSSLPFQALSHKTHSTKHREINKDPPPQGQPRSA